MWSLSFIKMINSDCTSHIHNNTMLCKYRDKILTWQRQFIHTLLNLYSVCRAQYIGHLMCCKEGSKWCVFYVHSHDIVYGKYSGCMHIYMKLLFPKETWVNKMFVYKTIRGHILKENDVGCKIASPIGRIKYYVCD